MTVLKLTVATFGITSPHSVHIVVVIHAVQYLCTMWSTSNEWLLST